ncbi:T-complex protein 11-domain-containing protein [Phaeosphaeria sp. MPI-PUGE-AT-0046c]|nr:T-complex protein 11-domain-containing protein [Phaeosphaeria sp. MPI-PUGE-AT-0046c]
MNPRMPKAASSRASSLRATSHSYSQSSSDNIKVEGSIECTQSSWHGRLSSRDGPLHDQRFATECASPAEHHDECISQSTYPPPPAPMMPADHVDYPEELAQMIITMGSGQDYEDLAEAYREASELPPITKLSLSELDIQHIITNVRLRHDVNFDRDLSFRPNLDGSKGQQKKKATTQYWRALEAELELYTRLFQGTPTPKIQDDERWATLVSHAQRRIPTMFRTIQDVLKSLVPERDHARVDEHLDVSMLMQEIQRGICDLVRLAEWLAQLLKEHCAPMRDGIVDSMVAVIRAGVVEHSSTRIVDGLRELFGILETMKLDVANHQIRNLKTLLIEDTVNFERHYHLEKLVSRCSRVDIDAAHAWYVHASWEFADQLSTQPRPVQFLQLEIFVRAVVAQFFNRNGRHEFPDTFYLDQDRLRPLKAEIEDLIHIEVCMDAFVVILKQFGCESTISPTIRHQLHTALLAIMGSVMGHGSHQWNIHSEALSLEILRQASLIAGRTQSFSHETLMSANDLLLHMFYNSSRTHNPRLERTLLTRIIACIDRQTNASAADLFNTLVPVAGQTLPQSTQLSHLITTNTSSFSHTSSTETARWQGVANRVAHVILVHWRIWERIAYVQDNGTRPTSSHAVKEPVIPSSQSTGPTESSQTSQQHDTQVVTTMMTGDSRESGQETFMSHEAHSQ